MTHTQVISNPFQEVKDGWERLSRVVRFYAAIGLKSNGIKTCGDYVFSGHTVIMTLLVLSINECKYYKRSRLFSGHTVIMTLLMLSVNEFR